MSNGATHYTLLLCWTGAKRDSLYCRPDRPPGFYCLKGESTSQPTLRLCLHGIPETKYECTIFSGPGILQIMTAVIQPTPQRKCVCMCVCVCVWRGEGLGIVWVIGTIQRKSDWSEWRHRALFFIYHVEVGGGGYSLFMILRRLVIATTTTSSTTLA